jgi:hypothetical protein
MYEYDLSSARSGSLFVDTAEYLLDLEQHLWQVKGPSSSGPVCTWLRTADFNKALLQQKSAEILASSSSVVLFVSGEKFPAADNLDSQDSSIFKPRSNGVTAGIKAAFSCGKPIKTVS